MSIILLGGGYWGTILARNLQQRKTPFEVVEPSVHAREAFTAKFPLVKVHTAWPSESHATHAIVATPPSTHLAAAQSALAHGCHVWVEKPVGLNGQEARALVRLAHQAQKHIMAGYLLNHLEVVEWLLHQRPAEWGALQHVACDRLGNSTPRSDVDVVHDLMVHDLALALRLLTRGHPRQFRVTTGHVQRSQEGRTAHAVYCDVPHGWEITCTASWSTPVKQRMLQCTFANGFMLRYDDGTKHVAVFRQQGGVWVPTEIPATLPLFPTSTPLMAQLDDFLQGPQLNGPDLILAVHDLLDGKLSAVPMFTLTPELERHGEQLAAATVRVVRSGEYIMGPEVVALEQALAVRLGTTHVVSCSSGTAALEMSLQVAGVGRGDRVVVPSFTFWATVEAVLNRGAVPVYVDVDEIALMKTAKAVVAVREHKAKAVIFVSLFGQTANRLDELAQQLPAEVVLIEDGAQSMGATGSCCPRRPQDFACTSFFPTKPLGGCGDGGAVFTQSAEAAAQLRVLRGHGFDRGAYRHSSTTCRLDAVQAAFIATRLQYFDAELLAGRRRVARRYATGLADCPELHTLHPVATLAADAVAVMAVTAADAALRDHLVQALDLRVYYRRGCHQEPASTGLVAGQLTQTARLCDTILALPLEPYMDNATVDEVVQRLRDAVITFAGTPATVAPAGTS